MKLKNISEIQIFDKNHPDAMMLITGENLYMNNLLEKVSVFSCGENEEMNSIIFNPFNIFKEGTTIMLYEEFCMREGKTFKGTRIVEIQKDGEIKVDNKLEYSFWYKL